MTEYVKSTNFASKDSLAVGNPLKIVKGTEFDTEFNNIAVAVATKADIANPTFTGVPAAPTAAAGTNTTQIATTAFVRGELLASVYPVGSIYINASSYTNPTTLLGFGTWVAFGTGRVMVGFDGLDPVFDNLGDIGGNKDAVVVSHAHSFSGTTDGVDDHTHTIPYGTSGASGTEMVNGDADNNNYIGTKPTNAAGAHSHTYSGTTATQGSSAANANLQPYITVAMWKRTA